MPVLTNVNIGTAISYVFDRCNISYDTSTWYTIGTTVTYNNESGLQNVSGWKDFLS